MEAMKPIERREPPYYDDRFICPVCGAFVGGYVINGGGENDWRYEENKFCRECGQKIDWSGENESSVETNYGNEQQT